MEINAVFTVFLSSSEDRHFRGHLKKIVVGNQRINCKDARIVFSENGGTLELTIPMENVNIFYTPMEE